MLPLTRTTKRQICKYCKQRPVTGASRSQNCDECRAEKLIPSAPDVLLFEDPTWMVKAACVSESSLFFSKASIDDAVAVCESCPVLSECRQRTLRLPHGVTGYGVWAGMTGEESKAARRQLKEVEVS